MSETRRLNWTVYLLALLFMGPLVGAWVWFFYFQEVRTESTSNLGELLTPAREVAVAGMGDASTAAAMFREQWTVLLISRGSCDLDCENMLYQSRQVWIRLGKESHRVTRVLASEAGALPEPITEQHPDLTHVSATTVFFDQFEAAKNLDIYLVDPRGFVVLRYRAPLDPAALYKDLTRLLKYSKIG